MSEDCFDEIQLRPVSKPNFVRPRINSNKIEGEVLSKFGQMLSQNGRNSRFSKTVERFSGSLHFFYRFDCFRKNIDFQYKRRENILVGHGPNWRSGLSLKTPSANLGLFPSISLMMYDP